MSIFTPASVLRTVVRLSRDFWAGPGRRRAWLLGGGAVAFALADIGMQVALNKWNRFFFDGIEKKSLPTLQTAALVFCGLVLASILVSNAASYCRQFLMLYWRQSMSASVLKDWLSGQAFYRMGLVKGADFAAEHRIAEDVRLTVEPVVDLVYGFFSSIVTLVAFAGILWSVGGAIDIGGWHIPGFMLVAALIYALVVSGMMVAIGRTYAESIRQKSEAEAQFRYEMTRVRENAESIALIRGEQSETAQLDRSLGHVVTRWRKYIMDWLNMTYVVLANGLVAPVVPMLLMMPKYLAGDVTLGVVTQTAAAFGSVQGALNWVTSNYTRIAEWYASASRVAELSAFVELVRVKDGGTDYIRIGESADDSLRLSGVSVRLYDGRTLVTDANFSIAPGEMALVMGPSGTGKSTLLRAIAGLWPWGRGEILLPKGGKVVFQPQRPYFPIGTLRAAISYPDPPGTFSNDEIVEILKQVNLPEFVARLDHVAAWDKLLSGGEMQRLAFARLALQKPSLAILDEATSALDEANEEAMMELFRNRLYDTAVISVAHRKRMVEFHTRRITMRRAGLQKVAAGPAVPIDEGSADTVWGRMRRALSKLRPRDRRTGTTASLPAPIDGDRPAPVEDARAAAAIAAGAAVIEAGSIVPDPAGQHAVDRKMSGEPSIAPMSRGGSLNQAD